MPDLGPLSALFNLRPDRAADYLLAKGFKLSGPYWELDGPAHSHVFTVANLAKLDVLADIKGAVQQAIDTGQTEKWFEAQLVDVLKRKGWWGPGVRVDPDTLEAKVIQQGSLRRLKTIYGTNLQSAYMAGRHRQAMEQIDRAPWAQYLAIRDHRTRPAHAALHGQVFRLDSPAWAVIAPTNGYNCRCRARYLSDRELANRGLRPAEDVRILERQPPGNRPVDILTGVTPDRWTQRGVSVPDPLNPGERLTLWADPGWDHLPGSDGAERALVDKLMAKATDLGDGVKMAVQNSLHSNDSMLSLNHTKQATEKAMKISYTFPTTHPITALRGLNATGGEWTTVMQGGKRVTAVAFDQKIQGKRLVATVAGKPELEALWVAHQAEQAAIKAAAAQAEAARALTLEGQREALVRAEYNTYSPDNFPGSAQWLANKRAADALRYFDAAHPEIKAAIEAARKAAEKARYDNLSDFVKRGS